MGSVLKDVLVVGTGCKVSLLSPCVSPSAPIVSGVSKDVLVAGKGCKVSQWSPLVSPAASVYHPVLPPRRSEDGEVFLVDISTEDSLAGKYFISVAAKKEVLATGGLGRYLSEHKTGEEDADSKEVDVVLQTHEEPCVEEPPQTQDGCSITDAMASLNTGSIGNCDNIDDHSADGGADVQVWNDIVNIEVLDDTRNIVPSISDRPHNPYVKPIGVGGIVMRGGSQSTHGICNKTYINFFQGEREYWRCSWIKHMLPISKEKKNI